MKRPYDFSLATLLRPPGPGTFLVTFSLNADTRKATCHHAVTHGVVGLYQGTNQEKVEHDDLKHLYTTPCSDTDTYRAGADIFPAERNEQHANHKQAR